MNRRDQLVMLPDFAAMPARCRNNTLRNGVHTVEDLLATSRQTILGWRNATEEDADTITALTDRLWGQVLKDEHLYEKCLHCHLFVEPNSAYEGQEGISQFEHLSRGDEADERFEDHEATPSGLIANLDTWRVFGPSAMRERFVTKGRA